MIHDVDHGMNFCFDDRDYVSKDLCLMTDTNLKSKSEILLTLDKAKRQNRVVAIYSTVLSDQPCLTSVVNVGLEANNKVIVTLVGYDVNGHFYERHRLTLDEIYSVVLFDSEFANPFLKHLNDREYDNMRLFRLY
jgi:hypothetical protein